MKRQGSVTDPLWYKDAIIYELHVRAFADSNNDGIGDFPGLLTKLDYLQDLGVTCLWLLPFFPSPLRDDGYDISDYLSVNPSYGTVDDFKRFLNAAHERNMQVMVELVINHTSDQHPWFQAARLAPPGSPERDFYVWSDSDKLYADARIIFTDTEKSNWTWDPVANQYYWHRFFSHQPDLNFDNPRVIEEVINIMRFWLDIGVDGLRMDAIPYLIERDGTNCENLPETHAAIKAIRAAIDEGYEGRLILAEANQWPEDVRPYFGEGDECHMAFHFPLMPRIYMALRQEDRLPITDIMAQTPAIPESCQWGIFLRNHDELTLEMVSNEERDYMYLAYSADPRMRINIGIRRRLAPLLDNNRRRIELLNSLLFSFPGTPILYYGDEIGMGDNIYLGDRNGVRTPMQWSGDRNAGFSRANPAKLFSPVIMDPVLGYEAVNVEAQQSDPSSLLNWMRNMISLRKLFQVFGRGTLRFLHPDNRKVLAYVREDADTRILCVANLSRFAQPVTLDLSEFDGVTPVEMLGYVEFPPITKAPYNITLGSYGFFWLELQPSHARETLDAMREATAAAQISLRQPHDWESVFAAQLFAERLLPDSLPRQRWFGAKSRTIASVAVKDWAPLGPASSYAMATIEVAYTEGEAEGYLLPLTLLFDEAAETFREASPNAVIGNVLAPGKSGVLADAMYTDEAATALLELLSHGGELPMRHGILRGSPSTALIALRGEGALPPRRSSAEQSNTSIFYGDRLIMKLFRRVLYGPNPDVEIGRYLTENSAFKAIAPFGGSLDYYPEGGEPATVAMLQGLVKNEGDGWQWTLGELERFYEGRLASQFPPAQLPGADDPLDPASAAMEQTRDAAGVYLDAACVLGRRTAEMHLALAQATDDPAFRPEPMSADDLRALQADLEAHGQRAFDTLRAGMGKLGEASEETVEQAGLVLSRRRAILDTYNALPTLGAGALQTRVHGDYHLGQTLRSKGDFVLLDFEGEPARPLAERRAKQSPMKDVAGMLRSFSYAAYAALAAATARRPQDYDRLLPWARLWESAVSAEFLHSYRKVTAGSAVVPEEEAGFRQLLDVYLLDKALYELVYELNNRPTWLRIPLSGILQLGRGPVAQGRSMDMAETGTESQPAAVVETPPAAAPHTTGLFIGVTGTVDPDQLRARVAEVATSGAFGGVHLTFSYPGAEHARTTLDERVDLETFPLPTAEGSASPWAQTAAAQTALLTQSGQSGAQAAVLLHPDLQALTPELVGRLARPVLGGQSDLVMGAYTLPPLDGLLNGSLLAPLNRALYGKNVRYPLAPDFAVSARLAPRLAMAGQSRAQGVGTPLLWPATAAAGIDGVVHETHLPIQHPRPGAEMDLSAVIAELVGSVFAEMEMHAPLWQRIRAVPNGLVAAAPHHGEPVAPIDTAPMIKSFLLGSRSLQDVWGLLLPPVTLLDLKRLTALTPDTFRMPDELWVRIVYDFALGYRLRTLNRAHLLGALTPLYLGRVASFVNEAEASPAFDAEGRQEKLARAFEEGKPYLVRRWRWPDRFNP